MLKLTSSFYRYLTVTCERVDYKSHVKEYSHLSSLREICKAGGLDLMQKRQVDCPPSSQKKGNPKKRPRTKTPLNLNELDGAEQMSEPGQPTAANVSYGGTFAISSDEEAPSQEFRRCTRSASRAEKLRQLPPNFRSWETVSGSHDSMSGIFKFKVVSYNVLAQYLLECHPYLYTECTARDLKWKVRSARLFEEIRVLAPDILCLQEVQLSHINSFYSRFEQIGYTGIFKQKTGDRQDGCAIYFKKSVFELKGTCSVEYYQPGLPLLNRDNIGVMAKLVPRAAPHTPIVVATTHLLYNPKRADVKLAQMQLFLAEIDRFSFYRNGHDCGHLPIILTGDFNSTPDSAVIRLLDIGHASAKETLRDNTDWERIGVTDNCQHLSVYLNRRACKETKFSGLGIYNSDYSSESAEEAGTRQASVTPGPLNKLFNSGDIWQTLQLLSVYDKSKGDGSMEATTFQDCWVTVDYMYYSRNSNLIVTDRLRLPAAVECSVLNRLPNEVFASDHLALAAVFEIIPPLDQASS